MFEKLLWAGSIEPATRCLEAILALALCYRACTTDHFVSSYRVLNTSELYPAKRATANLTTPKSTLRCKDQLVCRINSGISRGVAQWLARFVRDTEVNITVQK